MDLGIKNKKVLVVGASKGIGRATAIAFAKEGAVVSVVARSEDLLVDLVNEMGGESLGHRHRGADLLESGVPVSVVKSLESDSGEFDIVVHCVGGGTGARDPLSSTEEWKKDWDLNVGIAIDINNHIVPKMRERGWGRVIHVSSISGESLRGNALYAVSKKCLTAYSTVLGREVAQDGVVVSAVMPGAVSFDGSYWDKAKDQETEKYNDFLRHHQAIGRMGTTEEIAAHIVFLSSEQASFATGAAIAVDGGTM